MDTDSNLSQRFQIQQMIWTEFYRAPRYFTAEWAHGAELIKTNDEDKSKDDDDEDSEEYDSEYDWYNPAADDSRSRHYVWFSGWKVQPTAMIKGNRYYQDRTMSTEKANYYYSIDNTINQMSRNVAQGLRPRLQLPVWTWGTSDHRGFSSTISSHGRDTEYPFVNLDLDFLYIHQESWPQLQATVSERRYRWMRSIRNLLIDTEINVDAGSEDEVRREIVKGLTEENLRLWKGRLPAEAQSHKARARRRDAAGSE
ncbi:hypothetical protein CcaCcLH18_03856 [Colletotrichum camelliae]|nr:hypothetical protein CcaCcLH18_03856 [Colletotrichum camelliae]